MKSNPLVLILLGMLSLYGCSLPEPLDLGTKCSDETHGLTAVVYRRITCHSEDVTGENRDVCRDELIHCYPEDVTGEKKDVCGRFADAFEHGYCPMESPFCYDRVSDEFKCIFEHCGIEDGHEYEGKCEEDTTSHCGKHGKRCELGPNWLASQCKIDEGTGLAECVATDCMTGYALNAGECVKIVLSDLDNCGSYNTKCSNIVVGWQDGTCDQGMCIPSKCQTGYHLNEGSCVADDSNNCGSVGNVCGPGQVCTQGECSDNCGDSEVLCKDGGVVSCADPDTSTSFCGADASCSGYTTCKHGQACVGGECKQNSCTRDNETLCVVQGENVCIALNSDNADHCGMCNQKCSDRIMPNALSNTCSGGQCQYTCKEGYENCGIATVPNCINTAHFQNDPNNCGECGKTCNAGEFCNAGKCQKSTCTNQCLSNGTCINTNDKCGTQCIDCNSANNAASGTCNAGTCTISSCSTGFHLTTGHACERNTPTSCGSTNKADVVNCKTHNHASDGYCNENGQCVATSCEADYHVEHGACVQDSETACGAGPINCTKVNGWGSGKCEKGQCKATSCHTGYCLNGTTCVEGAYNASMCGINGGVCISCSTIMSCVNGKCVISGCDPNVCFYQGLTCSNTTEHCGKNCVNCNTANNASAGTCNVSAGTCTIKNCKSGFHKSKSGTSCVANTAISCAPPDSSVTVNCMTDGHATDGDCNENGQCVAKSCETGYTLSDGKCVESGGSGCKDHYITMNLEGRDVTAYCIETLEDLNNVYKDKIKAEAYALMQDFNLDELDVDTWKPFFVNGFKDGIFWGNGKTLSGNLFCSSDCGVFGPLMGAKILDLNLNVTITGSGEARIGAVSVAAENALLKNITSRGGLHSDKGLIGGLVVYATNKTTVESCLVIRDISVTDGGAGGLIYDSQASIIKNSSYEGTLDTNLGDATGGLVGILAEESAIEASYVVDKSEIKSNAKGKTENPTGGLVGSVLGNKNSISMSYFAGSVTSSAKVGGLVGMVMGGLMIEKSVVFGNITGMDSAFDAVGGLIGLIEGGNVTIQSSASVGDIEAPSSTVAGIAHITAESLKVHDLYHLGKINGLRTSYDDFVHHSGEIVSKHYLSWVKLQQYIEHDSISIAGNELLARKSGKNLVTDLNRYTKLNFGEESWATSMCTITTGPAGGEVIKYNLPLPRGLPKRPSFCE